MCCNALQYVQMETGQVALCVYSRLQNARYTAVNGTVFTEWTTERLCFVWERRALIVSG